MARVPEGEIFRHSMELISRTELHTRPVGTSTMHAKQLGVQCTRFFLTI